MQARSLKLRLQRWIDERYKDKERRPTIQDIGDELGLKAEVVVRRYLRNEVRRLDRGVLERACDWLNVDIGQLLELVPCDFFPHGDKLLRLCSKAEDPDDHEALGELRKLLSDVQIETAVLQSPVELARHVYESDCVIVGSPHHNIAGEIALCTLFSATPGNISDENRRKLPLMIEAPAEWQRANSLVMNAAETGRPTLQCRAMVPDTGQKSKSPDRTFDEKSSRAIADYRLKDFQQASFEKAKDFGIILVADHWVESERKVPVRTYWLSGFSSVGTLASLLALRDDVRSFSLDTPPDKPGEFVLSIVRATFHKKTGSFHGVLDEYEIVHTIRGSLPLPVQVPIDHGKDKSRDVPVGETLPPKSAVLPSSVKKGKRIA